MSLANLNADDVLAAEADAYMTCAFRLSYIFGDAAIERLLKVPANSLEAAKENWAASTDKSASAVADAPLLASIAFDYAWLGKAPGDAHSEDLVTDLLAIAQFFSVDTGMDAHDRSWPYAVIEGMPSNEILVSVCRAAYARWAIANDHSVSLPDLAALARVSEKTIRMAANPKNPGALKTTKQGNRTVVEADDALAWLSKRSDFRPTDTTTVDASGALLSVPEQLKNTRAAAERTNRFATALATAEIPLASWLHVEDGAGHPDLKGIDAVRLATAARHLALPHPEEFARRVIEHVFDNRQAKDRERLRRELAKLTSAQA